MKNNSIRKLTVMAMICAMGFIAMFVFRFNVGFLTFDFKDAIMSVASLIFGPLAGVICSVLVALLEFITIGDTGVYGLIMDILSSASFLLICGIVYKYKHTFSGAIIAAVCSVIGMTAVMCVANIFITPYYMHVESSDVVAMIPTLLFPFNLCKGIMNAAVMLLIYKPLSIVLRKAKLLVSTEAKESKLNKKTVILAICSVLVLVATALFIVFKLNGQFTLFDI